MDSVSKEAVTQADREAAWDFRPEGYGPIDAENWMHGRYDDNRFIQAFAAHRARFQEATRLEEGKWRDAVIDALVVSHIYTTEHDSDPRKAINDLCVWEGRIAVDPAVSKDAAALVAMTFRQAVEICRREANNSLQWGAEARDCAETLACIMSGSAANKPQEEPVTLVEATRLAVVEECARVALSVFDDEFAPAHTQQDAETIAAAIRALQPKVAGQ